MFSIQKLVIFSVILVVIWLAFRFVGNLEKQRRAQERLARPGWRERFRRGARAAGARAKEAARKPASDVEMTACGTCGDYVAATGAKACGRADCPYPTSA